MSEQMSFNQINEQESSAYLNRSDAKPSVLVKRTDGRVTVGRLDKETRDVRFTENGNEWYKTVSKESLSDENQQQLAAELAGVALRGDKTMLDEAKDTVAAKLDQQLNALKEKYGDKSRELWLYASGKINQQEYQQDGDMGSAKGEEQKAGQALLELRRMGPQAVEDAEKYLRLMRQLRAAR